MGAIALWPHYNTQCIIILAFILKWYGLYFPILVKPYSIGSHLQSKIFLKTGSNFISIVARWTSSFEYVIIVFFSHTMSGKFCAIEPGLFFLSFWSPYNLLILLQHSWGWTFREMCLVAVWQVRPRGAEEEVCPEGKGFQFLEFHFLPASVTPDLRRVCMHSVQYSFFFFFLNPVGLDVSN